MGWEIKNVLYMPWAYEKFCYSFNNQLLPLKDNDVIVSFIVPLFTGQLNQTLGLHDKHQESIYQLIYLWIHSFI